MKKRTLLFSFLLGTAMVLTTPTAGAEITPTLQSFKFQGKNYPPEKAKSRPVMQSKLLEQIQTAKEYDNSLAKQFKDNPKLIPFNDLFEEYSKVFKNNDVLLLDILNGNYNTKVLNAYLAYYENMLTNFKHNKELFAERDGNQAVVKNLSIMFDKLMVQHDGQIKFFDQLKKINL